MYTADPSARVFNDTLYVYPSHDEDTATRFSMQDWHVFSTTDMQNWTDHGIAFSLNDVSWAESDAWAPDCIERNGKYYFYYPVEQSKIGVAVGCSTGVGVMSESSQANVMTIKANNTINTRLFFIFFFPLFFPRQWPCIALRLMIFDRPHAIL